MNKSHLARQATQEVSLYRVPDNRTYRENRRQFGDVGITMRDA
jgi:hypothetical protein